MSHAPSELLELVRGEATKFGRCCDLYQDSFGTFADHECQQRTFAMLRSVQEVLGVKKDGSPLSEKEIADARARAVLSNSAPTMAAELDRLRAVNADLLAALQSIAKGLSPGSRTIDELIRDQGICCDIARAAIARAKEEA